MKWCHKSITLNLKKQPAMSRVDIKQDADSGKWRKNHQCLAVSKAAGRYFLTHKKEMMTGMIALDCYLDIEHYKDGWVWYPFIPRKGITLLLGAPGIRLSMFLMQVIAVLTGKHKLK